VNHAHEPLQRMRDDHVKRIGLVVALGSTLSCIEMLWLFVLFLRGCSTWLYTCGFIVGLISLVAYSLLLIAGVREDFSVALVKAAGLKRDEERVFVVWPTDRECIASAIQWRRVRIIGREG